MKIYGIKIKMPHSGNITRSQVITVLKKAILNNYSGIGDFDNSKFKEECKYYNTLLIEDINYEFNGILNWFNQTTKNKKPWPE